MEELKVKLVDFETAKRLRMLGFPQTYAVMYCIRDCYSEDGDRSQHHNEGDLVIDLREFSKNDWISAPSLDLVRKWLVERHNQYVDVSLNMAIDLDKRTMSANGYKVSVIDTSVKDLTEMTQMLDKKASEVFATYDDALEFGIKKALEIIK